MLSHVIPQCLVTDRIPIKLQLTGKSRLIFKFIGEAVRSIIDVMDYTKEQNIPGILLFIDFEKAFDSLNWNFLLKCLNVFGFGPSLIRWIGTFYTNISSCVLNNGLCSQYFEVQRGVRQGDPLSLTYSLLLPKF